jgi:hypothetical protein
MECGDSSPLSNGATSRADQSADKSAHSKKSLATFIYFHVSSLSSIMRRMTPISDTQEFARRFNEEEAIWQRFQEKRLTRRLLEADSPLPETVLDDLDWLEAEREIRTTRAVATHTYSPCVRLN